MCIVIKMHIININIILLFCYLLLYFVVRAFEFEFYIAFIS
jgi:hypothetical protein